MSHQHSVIFFQQAMLVCTGVYTFDRPGLGLQNPERIEKKRIETAQIEGDEHFDGFCFDW